MFIELDSWLSSFAEILSQYLEENTLIGGARRSDQATRDENQI